MAGQSPDGMGRGFAMRGWGEHDGKDQSAVVPEPSGDCLHDYRVINPWQREACFDDMRHCRERGFIGCKP